MPRGLSGLIIALGLAFGLAVFPAWADSPVVRAIPHGELRTGPGGYLRVSAIGMPSFGATDETTAREEAREHAVALAQRRLIMAILALPVGKSTVRERLEAAPQARGRLRALIARARVSGQELADGSAEVTLELPFSGPNGLSEFLAGLSQ